MKSENPVISSYHPSGNFLGESPLWWARSQSLYWINCENEPALFCLDTAGGELRQWPMPERIGAVYLDEAGGIIVALASGIFRFDPDAESLTLIAANPHPESVVLHEGKCDRQGRLWVGSLSNKLLTDGELGGAFFYRLDGDTLVPMISDITVANGLAWSPDGATMYQADTLAETVWQWDYDIGSGAIANRRVFVNVPQGEGMLDGAAVDAEGGYWVALFEGGCLRRYAPNGALDREIRLPISQPTMPAFGGEDLRTLFITSTQHGKTLDELRKESGLGDIYRIEGLARGLPEPFYKPGC